MSQSPSRSKGKKGFVMGRVTPGQARSLNKLYAEGDLSKLPDVPKAEAFPLNRS
jgi:hypothetical protein